MAFLLLFGILIAAAAWAILRRFERSLLYTPNRTLASTPREAGLAFQNLSLAASDRVRLSAWFVEGNEDKAVLLFLHGKSGNISHRIEYLRLFHAMGYSTLMVDYRGYGLSEGRPSEAGTYRDAEAAYALLRQTRRLPERRIIFYGESLGCGVAVELALRHAPSALILESPFTSVIDMARWRYPTWPSRWLVHERYDNLSKIGRVRCPVLVLHSRQDDVVPFEMGRRLYNAASEPKRFIELRGSHRDDFKVSGDTYTQGVRSFIESRPMLAADRP